MDRDLDAANYSVAELATFFRFPDLESCSLADIELREAEMRELIITSPGVEPGYTARIITFMADAKRELLHARRSIMAAPQIQLQIQPQSQQLPPPPQQPLYIVQDIGTTLPDAHTNISAICIDSLFRDDTKQPTGEFVMTLAKPMTNVVSIKPVSAEVPISWHAVSAARQNNEMTVFIFNATYYTPVNSQRTITIADGTYSKDTFAAALNAAFAAAGGGAEYLMAEFDAITGATVIRTKTAADVSPDLPSAAALPFDVESPHYAPDFYFVLDFTLADGRAQPLCKNLGWIAGFRAKWYTVKRETSATSASIASEARFEPRPGNYVFIEVEDFTTGAPADVVMSRALAGAHIGRNVIARISVAATIANNRTIAAGSSGDRVFYKRVYSGPVSISKLKVRLIDRFGDTIDLRGSDLSLVLEIETAIGRTTFAKFSA
jgi:hypothetical protein